MTEDQIKHMVDRFLNWKLPPNFCPDGGISFQPYANFGTEHQYKRDPSGTNLFDATQADEMVRYLVDGLPATPSPAPGETLALANEFEQLRATYGILF